MVSSPAPDGPRPRKVLLITEWFLPVVGGSVNLFVNAYRTYPEGTIHVLTGHPLKEVGSEGPPSPYPTTRVDTRRFGLLRPESLLLYLRLLGAAIRLCLTEKPDVVHCGHVFPEAVVARVLRFLFGIPYLVFVHGEEVSIQRHYASKRRLMPWLYNGAAAVVANSQNSRRLVESVGVDSGRIHVIHPGVELERFAPGPRPPDDEVRLLSVGRLWPRKGHAQVIEAVARIHGSHPGLRYWIAGTGGKEEELRRLARERGVEDRIRFLGYVPEEELSALYRSCDVFVLANRRLANDDMEGFGIVFLEAAASGLPVVGGRTGGVPDAVSDGRNGFLVDTEDVPALAAVLDRLLGDRALRRRMGEESRRWAEGFSWDGYSRSIRALSDAVARPASSS
jgi:phosphatidylinositol alpha-1,6-mannosyltransferase